MSSTLQIICMYLIGWSVRPKRHFLLLYTEKSWSSLLNKKVCYAIIDFVTCVFVNSVGHAMIGFSYVFYIALKPNISPSFLYIF